MASFDHESEGLTSAAARLAEYGANLLPEERGTPWWKRVLNQLKSPIIYILLFALAFDAGISLIEGAAGWPVESLAILAILTLNAANPPHRCSPVRVSRSFSSRGASRPQSALVRASSCRF